MARSRRLALALAALLAAACGARTGLREDPIQEDDASVPGPDASDAKSEDAADVQQEPDSSKHDVADAEAEPEAEAEAAPPLNECPDADSTLVYAITEYNELLSFYPPTGAFHLIGHVACASGTATPWSMAVERTGIAWSVFNDGRLFRISTANASCKSTSYQTNQHGFLTFGMGFLLEPGESKERLFVVDSAFTGTSKGLATIDLETFDLAPVVPFDIAIPGAELTGTGDGKLYVYWMSEAPTGSFLSEVDIATGKLLAPHALAAGGTSFGHAVAFWGGDFWIFTSTSGSGQVTRYRPSDQSEVLITSVPYEFVGAGVSTCAPQQ